MAASNYPGVSGHRDLDPDDVASLHTAVSDFVRQLKQWLWAYLYCYLILKY